MAIEFPDPLWRKVFEQAWESYTTGGWGVGAVVLDAEGRLLGEGRNRSADTEAALRQLTGTPLAHAELNALAAAGDDLPTAGTVVRTTLEPCALCASAIALRRVARVEFAGADPLWHGLYATHRTHPLLAQRWPAQVGPLTDDGAPLAVLAEALPLSAYLRTRGRGAASTQAYATHSPALLGLAQAIADDDAVLDLDLDALLAAWGDRIEETQPTRLRPSVIQVGADDWERVRDVRIASLAESPQAFGSTVAQALTFDEQRWRDRAETATTWHAVLGDRSVGSITLRADPDAAGTAEITGMWVDPQARGRGAGALLVDTAVAAWRRLAGRRVVLWVVQGNEAATGLYERCGFRATGRTELEDDGRVELELERLL
ncbi:GNAT family N-acetyltransferase [Angustibacter luteus]|uniref:GNAT family N-acetyltransferase n=1 Tax=Angustibacter luteus TaxID=658456 RepID=A0ABW1JG52_9ACTN